MLSCRTTIRLRANPKRAFGRSITSRGGESSVWMVGTSVCVETISTAATPCSRTTRTLFTHGKDDAGLPAAPDAKFAVVAAPANSTNSNTRRVDGKTNRGTDILGSGAETILKGTDHLREDAEKMSAELGP